MNPERLEAILDGWWQERKQELLDKLMSEIRANVGDYTDETETVNEFTEEIYVPSNRQYRLDGSAIQGHRLDGSAMQGRRLDASAIPVLSMFSETILPPANSEELARVGMNLLNFSLGSILNMFPEVPILPNPEMETSIHEIMSEPTRRRNFFANFTIPDSLEWPVVVNRSLPVRRSEESGQECSICLDNISTNSHIFPLSCGHQFHCHCLSRVLCEPGQVRCPLCRNEIQFSNS
jgi:hypothetical protein